MYSMLVSFKRTYISVVRLLIDTTFHFSSHRSRRRRCTNGNSWTSWSRSWMRSTRSWVRWSSPWTPARASSPRSTSRSSELSPAAAHYTEARRSRCLTRSRRLLAHFEQDGGNTPLRSSLPLLHTLFLFLYFFFPHLPIPLAFRMPLQLSVTEFLSPSRWYSSTPSLRTMPHISRSIPSSHLLCGLLASSRFMNLATRLKRYLSANMFVFVFFWFAQTLRTVHVS